MLNDNLPLTDEEHDALIDGLNKGLVINLKWNPNGKFEEAYTSNPKTKKRVKTVRRKERI